MKKSLKQLMNEPKEGSYLSQSSMEEEVEEVQFIFSPFVFFSSFFFIY